MMFCSETSDRLVFVVDKGLLRGPIDSVIDSIYSHIKTHLAADTIGDLEKEVKVEDLIQRIRETPLMADNAVRGSNQPEETEINHDDTYYLDMITFEVQNTEFLVPKNRLLEGLDAFSFSLESGFGASDNPILLPGVTANDFRRFMKYLYPLKPKYRLTINDWISTTIVSTQWKMLEIRETAIQRVGNALNPVQKVELGDKCKVVDWLRSGYIGLVQRLEHFTEDEVDIIGLDRAVKLCQIREQDFAGVWTTYNRFTIEARGVSDVMTRCFADFVPVEDLDEDLVDGIFEAWSLSHHRLFVDACGRLVRRPDSLTLDEAKCLGLPLTIEIWKARIEARRIAKSLLEEIGKLAPILTPISIPERVLAAFKEELDDIGEAEARYKTVLIQPK